MTAASLLRHPQPIINSSAEGHLTNQSPYANAAAPDRIPMLHRLLRKARPDVAEQEIAALLREKSPREIPGHAIADILIRCRCYGDAARKACMAAWSRALTYFAHDDLITDDEAAYLDDLTRLLDIGCDDILAIYGDVVAPRYREAVEAAAADGVLTATERQALGRLAVSLRIPDDDETNIRIPVLQHAAQQKFNELTADRRLSPDEIQEYLNLDDDLGIALSIDAETDLAIQRYQQLWRIENGGMKPVPSALSLPSGEQCYFTAAATWLETRTKTTRVDYAGPVASIRIAKGLRFRLGSVVPNRVTTEQLTVIDHGSVYFTNKRIIFDGQHRNLAVRLSALIAVSVYSDGLMAEKATGRSPVFTMAPDRVDFAAATLTTLLAGR